MKKLLFCLLVPFISLFSETPSQENFPKIEASWDWDDTCLFLDLTIDPNLEFGNTYDTFTLQNGNLGAEIHFYPLEICNIVKDDYLLKDIVFTIYLSNDPTNSSMHYKITKKFIYQNSDWFSSTKTSSTTVTGKISNTELDLSGKPEFFIHNNSTNKACFSFKTIN